MTYLLYVAWKIATAPMINSDDQATGAPAYRDGFILNLLNPKAYAAFLALFAQFTLPETAGINGTLLTAMLIFTMVVIVDIIWLGFGGMIRPLFHSPTLHRKIRIGFALLMVASVIWVFFK